MAFAKDEAMRDYFLGCTVHVHHKGGNSQKQMDLADQLSAAQEQMMQQTFQQAQQRFNTAQPIINNILQNNGMLPQQQAAMTTQALQGLGQQYGNLQGQLSQALTARGITGGQFAGSGDIARNFGQLGAIEAGQQSQLLNQIQLAKGQGLNNALGMELGLGSTLGQLSLGQGQQGVSALGIGQQAGQAADQSQTGFWGSVIGGLAGLGGSVATAACPAIGSHILMADGSEKLVEEIKPSDAVMGVDGEPCIVEEIPSELTEVICVTFEDGHVTLNSPTHAFALAKGGFTVSAKSIGKSVMTSSGTSKVLFIQRGGTKRVFNIITDGSHTYRADGVWALGVGDAERHIPMDTWSKIGQELVNG